jgi:hypothetical protein
MGGQEGAREAMPEGPARKGNWPRPPPRQFRNAVPGPRVRDFTRTFAYREWGEALAHIRGLECIRHPKRPQWHDLGSPVPTRGRIGLSGQPLLGRPEGRAVPEPGF